MARANLLTLLERAGERAQSIGDSRAARAQLKELRFSHVVLISAQFGSYVRLALIKASKARFKFINSLILVMIFGRIRP